MYVCMYVCIHVCMYTSIIMLYVGGLCIVEYICKLNAPLILNLCYNEITKVYKAVMKS